jgi:Beta-propeller repeat
MLTRLTFAVAAAALALPAAASARHAGHAPAVGYASYFGGISAEGCSAAPGRDGALYVACGTGSPNLPRVGGLQSYQGLEDGYIAKLDRSRRRIVWSTYLGSPGEDEIDSMAVDARGHVFVSGFAAAGFPTTHGAFDPTFNGVGECCDGLFGDAFVAELSPDGSRLLYSTYLGGSGHDRTNTLALAEDGSVVVTGFTGSADFPTTRGALDATFGGGTGTFEDVPVDAFAAKLSPDGSRLVYSTYLGGSGDDVGNSVAVDDDGSAYFTGFTGSPEFPTTRGALKPRPDATVLNGYVTKLDRTGRVAWSTYLGGTNRDSGWGIGVDAHHEVIVSGSSNGGFPVTPGAAQTTFGGVRDFFVAKLDRSGARMDWATYLGGSEYEDLGATVAVDEEGNADVVGSTVSTDFPVTRDAFQPANAGGFDLAISRLDRNGRLRFASYLGGRGDEFGGAAGLDQRGAFYPGGVTSSTDFPVTRDAFQPVYGGGDIDGLLLKIRFAQ